MGPASIVAEKSNKRKRLVGSSVKDVEAGKRKKISLKPTSNSSTFNVKALKKPMKKPHQKSNLPSSEKMSSAPPANKREARHRAKELAESRKKKRKKYYNLEQELALLWEKMRRRNISKEERAELVTEALQKMKGKIPEIASSHVSSRVLQTCIKFCSEVERNPVFEELQPHFLSFACNKYAVHLVNKMLDNASKSQLESFFSNLHGHIAPLLRHVVGSIAIEHAYQLANGTQKRKMLMELYSTELQLFKDLTTIKEKGLVDIISALGLNKSSVCRHMTTVIQPILEKGIVDHSIIHKVLLDYFTIANQTSAEDVIQHLAGPLIVRMIHTREGSKVGILCIKHGSAKERKKIIKGMKGVVVKTAHDLCGSLVLACLLSVVDDTKLLSKVVLQELQSNLKELVLDKNGRRPLLQLLRPYCHRYFSPEDLSSLDSFIPSLHSEAGVEWDPSEPKQGKAINDARASLEGDANDSKELDGKKDVVSVVEGGKKDPLVRRQELLIKSGLAEKLVDTCIENAEELLTSNFGKEVLYEVATGGADGILHPSLDDKLTSLYETIASFVAKPKSDDAEHPLDNFHSSRTIRKLVLDCPACASVLWKKALQGNCETWARGHSSKVILAFMESSDAEISALAKKELQPLINGGILTVSEAKLAGKAK